MLFFALYAGLQVSAGLWGTSFLTGIHKLTDAQAGTVLSVFYAGITAGRLLSGFIVEKLGNMRMIRCGVVSMLLSAVFLALPVPGFYLIGFILLGAGCAPVFPCMIYETPKRFGPENAAAAVGFQSSAASMGRHDHSGGVRCLPTVFSRYCYGFDYSLRRGPPVDAFNLL
jgi:fucose permease